MTSIRDRWPFQSLAHGKPSLQWRYRKQSCAGRKRTFCQTPTTAKAKKHTSSIWAKPSFLRLFSIQGQPIFGCFAVKGSDLGPGTTASRTPRTAKAWCPPPLFWQLPTPPCCVQRGHRRHLAGRLRKRKKPDGSLDLNCLESVRTSQFTMHFWNLTLAKWRRAHFSNVNLRLVGTKLLCVRFSIRAEEERRLAIEEKRREKLEVKERGWRESDQWRSSNWSSGFVGRFDFSRVWDSTPIYTGFQYPEKVFWIFDNLEIERLGLVGCRRPC